MHPSHTPPAGRHDVGLDESATVERTHPTAVLRRAGDAVVLDLGWTGHLQVPDDTSEAISAAEMEALLPGLRRGAAEYIVPQATPGTPPEMRYFDPNRCGCLDWSKKYPPGSRWAYMPAWSGGAGCRGDASHRLLRFSRDRKGVTKGVPGPTRWKRPMSQSQASATLLALKADIPSAPLAVQTATEGVFCSIITEESPVVRLGKGNGPRWTTPGLKLSTPTRTVFGKTKKRNRPSGVQTQPVRTTIATWKDLL